MVLTTIVIMESSRTNIDTDDSNTLFELNSSSVGEVPPSTDSTACAVTTTTTSTSQMVTTEDGKLKSSYDIIV